MSALDFHHVGVAVADIDKALPHYREILGYTEVDGPYDDPIQRVRVAFLTSPAASNPCIELIAPLDKDAPVNRYLSKDAGAYHLCFTVDDMEATLQQVRAKGWMLISGPVPAVAFQLRRIAWLFMPTRQLVELVERNQRS